MVQHLPDDLLSMVYRRLTSPLDRVRFAAVGKPWRAIVSRCPAPPAPPLLLLSPRGDSGLREKHLIYCPEDGGVLRVPLPRKAIDKWFVGSHDGGWIAATGGPLVIFNMFSGAEVKLSAKQRRIVCKCPSTRRQQFDHLTVDTGAPFSIWKIIFSEAPTSSSCILAAITYSCRVALCRVGCPGGGWTVEGCGSREKLTDIAFCRGELYGLTRSGSDEILLKFDVGVNKHGAPAVTAVHKPSVQGPVVPRRIYMPPSVTFLVELRGKLAMARLTPNTLWSPVLDPAFMVFELADDAAPYEYRWAEVTSLGDHALFLGPAFSRAVRMPAARRGDVQRNRIYYSNHDASRRPEYLIGLLYLMTPEGGSPVYYREDDEVAGGAKKIMSRGYHVGDGLHAAMWLLPPRL